MKIADVPGLPPRAKKALPTQELVESLNQFTRAEIERTPGVGEAAIQALLDAGWEPKVRVTPTEDAMEIARRVMPPEDETDRANLEMLAEHFVDLMANQAALTPGLVAQAWEAALSFGQESNRARGVYLVLHDGLVVRLHGQDFRIQTRVKAGEDRPAGSRAVLLVPEP